MPGSSRLRASWPTTRCWIVLPTIVWGPFAGMLIYTAIGSVVGICLALVFAPAHIGLPVVSDQPRDWLHPIETTRNLELPRVVSIGRAGRHASATR